MQAKTNTATDMFLAASKPGADVRQSVRAAGSARAATAESPAHASPARVLQGELERRVLESFFRRAVG